MYLDFTEKADAPILTLMTTVSAVFIGAEKYRRFSITVAIAADIYKPGLGNTEDAQNSHRIRGGGRVRRIVISVCLSVSLSSRISQKPGLNSTFPKFTKFSVHITCGSVLL